MLDVIVFSKMFKDRSVPELIQLAHEIGAEGYDLCVRPAYPINPDNAAEKLPEAVKAMNAEGVRVPMVTGNFDLLAPDHPTAEPILDAMNKADVRFLKLGYFKIDPHEQDYWTEVDKIRRHFEGWQVLAEKYNVTICYHTHSNRHMGWNCSSLAHLIRGFDPRRIGAYLDPLHLLIDGEEFALGLAVVKEHFQLIALKDVMLEREEKNGHGAPGHTEVIAGTGMVDWTAVFDELKRAGYRGPLSVHCEFKVAEDEFMDAVKHDVAFFKAQRDRIRS